MTYPLNIYAEARDNRPSPAEIIGPYSPWPRKTRRPIRFYRNAALAGGVAGLAVVVHCALPVMA